MPETVSIDSQHDIVVIESHGDVQERDLHQSLNSVLHIVTEQGLKKVMVDARYQTSIASTMALYSFGIELVKKTKSLRHELVVAEQSAYNMSFIENVASNRGVAMKTFSSRDDALSWLNKYTG